MTLCSFIYTTAPSKEAAERLASALIEQKLAACANILDGMTSMYRWEGNVERAQECVVIFKTQNARIDAAMKAIRSLHTYENPCIVALPISTGSPDFLAWIATETTV